MRIDSRTLALVVMMAMVGTAGAVAAPTVKGDAKAWAEIDAALTRLPKLKTYRMKITEADGRSSTTAVVNPDRYHWKGTNEEGKPGEMIMVGSQKTRVREAGGEWTCVDFQIPLAELDPKKMTGEVTAARGPAVTIEGVRTQSYTYSWKTEYGIGHFKLFVAGNGLPGRMQFLDDNGRTVRTWDFFDVDAPIAIALPACR